ncbi:MAG: hypothetical protein IPH65_14010 [Dehalococcoidia bacterium]|uniref:hypothetical protein n=1 Tax=Candidatus Amarobacter glycogenicus TaxID=3140699 RepID=UPI0031356444|nr:hypothetical protein [Dehalococcoidia bacterium]
MASVDAVEGASTPLFPGNSAIPVAGVAGVDPGAAGAAGASVDACCGGTTRSTSGGEASLAAGPVTAPACPGEGAAGVPEDWLDAAFTGLLAGMLEVVARAGSAGDPAGSGPLPSTSTCGVSGSGPAGAGGFSGSATRRWIGASIGGSETSPEAGLGGFASVPGADGTVTDSRGCPATAPARVGSPACQVNASAGGGGAPGVSPGADMAACAAATGGGASAERRCTGDPVALPVAGSAAPAGAATVAASADCRASLGPPGARPSAVVAGGGA